MAAAAARIVALAIAAAVAYGIAHDQVTARACVEYFTIGHGPIFGTDSPTLLGIGWGIVATWWVGLLLGLPPAFAALRGPWPRRSARSLVRPMAKLLAGMAGTAAIAGAIGFVLARSGIVVLLEPLASHVPRERHAAFLADLWAHRASGRDGSMVQQPPPDDLVQPPSQRAYPVPALLEPLAPLPMAMAASAGGRRSEALPCMCT